MEKATVLLVDDDESALAFIKKALEKLNYVVLEASNGPQALLLCDEHQGKIDLLLSDVIMPGIKGNELLHYVEAKQPGVRILLMSGHPGGILAEYGMAGSGVNFIQKPFNIEELRETVSGILGDE